MAANALPLCGLVIGVCAAALLVRSVWPSLIRRSQCASTMTATLTRSLATASRLGVLPKLKLLLGYYQVVLAVPLVYDVHLPHEYVDAMRVFELIRFDWDGVLSPAACVGDFGTRLALVATTPLVLFALVVLYGLLKTAHRYRGCIGNAPKTADIELQPSTLLLESARDDGTPRSTGPRFHFGPAGPGRRASEASRASRVLISEASGDGSQAPQQGITGDGSRTASNQGASSLDASSGDASTNIEQVPRVMPSKVVSEGLLFALPTTLFCCFLLVPSVARRIFSSFSCDAFGYDDRGRIEHYYLHTDYSIRCSDASYRSEDQERIKLMAFFFVILWPVGVCPPRRVELPLSVPCVCFPLHPRCMLGSPPVTRASNRWQAPVLFGALLYVCRRAIQDAQPTKLSEAALFITREYKPLTYYWELVDLVRKLLLTGFVLLVPQHLNFLRMILAIVLSISYLVLLTVAQPYRQRSTAFVAVATQLSLVFTLFAALLVKVIDIVASSGQSHLRLLGFSNAFPFTVIILCINFGVLLLVFGLIVQQVADERVRNMLLGKEDLATLVDEMEHAHQKERATHCEETSERAASSVRRTRLDSLGQTLWNAKTHAASRLTRLIREPQGGKHECHVRELVAGEVEDAVRGLPHFMGVPDPFASAGVEILVNEVASFVSTLRGLSLVELRQRGFDRYARAGQPGGPANEAAAIIATI